MAKKSSPCSKNNYCDPYKNTKIQNIILMDMIGAKDIHLTLDAHSSPKLLNLAVNLDKKPNKPLYKTSGMSAIDDDHSFCRLGISCLNIIDFHHLQNWHKASDLQQKT